MVYGAAIPYVRTCRDYDTAVRVCTAGAPPAAVDLHRQQGAGVPACAPAGAHSAGVDVRTV